MSLNPKKKYMKGSWTSKSPNLNFPWNGHVITLYGRPLSFRIKRETHNTNLLAPNPTSLINYYLRNRIANNLIYHLSLSNTHTNHHFNQTLKNLKKYKATETKSHHFSPFLHTHTLHLQSYRDESESFTSLQMQETPQPMQEITTNLQIQIQEAPLYKIPTLPQTQQKTQKHAQKKVFYRFNKSLLLAKKV